MASRGHQGRLHRLLPCVIAMALVTSAAAWDADTTATQTPE